MSRSLMQHLNDLTESSGSWAVWVISIVLTMRTLWQQNSCGDASTTSVSGEWHGRFYTSIAAVITYEQLTQL